MLKWDTPWRVGDTAGLPRFRFHDLRHTVLTELAELRVAEHVLESISGHLSRRRSGLSRVGGHLNGEMSEWLSALRGYAATARHPARSSQ